MHASERLEAVGLLVRRKGRTILDGIDLRLSAAERVDLEGPSGAGKSTLLLALARLLPATKEGRGWAGELRLDGLPDGRVPGTDWRRRVVYVAQRPVALPGTVAQNLEAPFRLRVRREEALPEQDTLQQALQQLAPEVHLDAPARQLSGGELCRVALLRAALTSPEVLLLDEPDAMLDAAAAAAVDRFLQDFCARGGTVLRASHHGRHPAPRRLRLRAGRLEEA